MPSESLDRLRDVADKAEKASQGDVAQLAMLHTVRGMTEVLERIAGQQDRTDVALEKIVETMHTFDKRLTVIENDTLIRRVDALEVELKAQQAKVLLLEFAEHGRKVERNIATSVMKSPALGWVVAGLLALIGALRIGAVMHGVAP